MKPQKIMNFVFALVTLVALISPVQTAVAPITGDIVTLDASPVLAGKAIASLKDFVATVKNGSGSQIVGLYSPNLFALRVVQQPSGNSGYVSTSSGTATQFRMASSYGSIGMLAHNYLAGASFASLGSGKEIDVIYGDGKVVKYKVSTVRKYQALSPSSMYSDFKDLSNPSKTLSVSDVFYATYGKSGALVLQTCISKNGDSSWGRLFVIAYKSS